MKVNTAVLILSATAMFIGACLSCAAQEHSVPTSISTSLDVMFPQAKNVAWKTNPENVQAVFTTGGMICEAKFSPDGKWIMTERQITTDSLPDQVKAGLKTTPYSDWSIVKAFVLLFPKNANQYRLVVVSKEMIKKIVSFDLQGQLLKNSLTL